MTAAVEEVGGRSAAGASGGGARSWSVTVRASLASSATTRAVSTDHHEVDLAQSLMGAQVGDGGVAGLGVDAQAQGSAGTRTGRRGECRRGAPASPIAALRAGRRHRGRAAPLPTPGRPGDASGRSSASPVDCGSAPSQGNGSSTYRPLEHVDERHRCAPARLVALAGSCGIANALISSRRRGSSCIRSQPSHERGRVAGGVARFGHVAFHDAGDVAVERRIAHPALQAAHCRADRSA